jgi:MOSC domain-containing protein YiiM
MAQTFIDDADAQFAEHVPYHRSLAEIEAAYATASSPLVEGVLELVVRRPAELEREVVEVAELTEADGLVGDNWATRSVKSTPDGSPDPLRQLTIMNARALEAVAGSRDRWQLAGDQLIVDLDLSIDNLAAGSRLLIGGAEVEVSVPPHVGCSKFSGRFGLDALRFVSSREGKRRRLRGLNARVIRPGPVRRGDRVVKL